MTDLLPLHWQSRFFAMADLVASWSKDPSTKVGAVIVSPDRRQIAVGYNGFPAGMADDDRLNNREAKYPRTIHAEHNALLNAQFDVAGCHLFVTFPPCLSCASVIIQMRIGRVYCPSSDDERWGGEQKQAMGELRAAGVDLAVGRPV